MFIRPGGTSEDIMSIICGEDELNGQSDVFINSLFCKLYFNREKKGVKAVSILSIVEIVSI